MNRLSTFVRGLSHWDGMSIRKSWLTRGSSSGIEICNAADRPQHQEVRGMKKTASKEATMKRSVIVLLWFIMVTGLAVLSKLAWIQVPSTIVTVARHGNPDFSGDVGPATHASLNRPTEVAVAGAGHLSITDQSPHRSRKVNTPQRILDTFEQLPLWFEANQGQTTSQVKFLARGSGYTLFLTPTEAVLALTKPQVED